jgi:hypothetical protein
MASLLASRCFRASALQPLAKFNTFGARFASVAVGDKVPSVNLHKGFPPEKVPLAELCKGKKVVLVGLPGAFTPT